MKKPDDGNSVEIPPERDPALAIVTAIITIVPAASWAFARVASDGELHGLLPGSAEPAQLDRLRGEFRRQRQEVKIGPRIAVARTFGPNYDSGVTLIFADTRASFGILALLRDAEWGPFTSSEIRMLTFALSAASDHFAAFALLPVDEPPARERHDLPAAEPGDAAFYVLDTNLEITLARQSDVEPPVALSGLKTRVAERLPPVLEETVRGLIANWGSEPASRMAGVARPVPFLVVRTQPMTGRGGLFVGVNIDRFRPVNSLSFAAARYHISPRELQVLSLLLDGAHLDEIGRKLFITSSTVQDHVKSMVEKTETRNRTELVARVLGWSGAPS